MHKTKWLIIFIGCLLIASETFGTCKGNSIKAPPNSQNHDRSWVKSDKPIFFATKHKIFKTWFNSNERILLTDKFNWGGAFKLSQDKNYLYYRGDTKEIESTSYLYNLRSGEEYELQILKNINEFEFSPDSKKAVLIRINRIYKPTNFFIMNLENKSFESVPYPKEVFSLNDFRGVEAKWSLDARYIYLRLIAYPIGGNFSYDTESKQITKIDEQYQYYEPLPLQSQSCFPDMSMGGANAVIDKDYNLNVTTQEGNTIFVDKGGYDDCEGVTICIKFWIENGKYLVYSNPSHMRYIYGVEENKKAILFDSDVIYYGWESSENWGSEALRNSKEIKLPTTSYSGAQKAVAR